MEVTVSTHRILQVIIQRYYMKIITCIETSSWRKRSNNRTTHHSPCATYCWKSCVVDLERNYYYPHVPLKGCFNWIAERDCEPTKGSTVWVEVSFALLFVRTRYFFLFVVAVHHQKQKTSSASKQLLSRVFFFIHPHGKILRRCG